MGKMVKVRNRNSGYTGYFIPDTGVRRNFTPEETKEIDIEELRQLQWVDGGDYLLKHCFLINDQDALSVLNMSDVEPEYFYTEAEIKELLNNGTLAQLEDCLNFAPQGVIDLVKEIAVKTEIPDIRKRDMISEKTGLNINNAIMINHVMATETEAPVEKKTTRKAEPIATGTARKAAPVKTYNVVNRSN